MTKTTRGTGAVKERRFPMGGGGEECPAPVLRRVQETELRTEFKYPEVKYMRGFHGGVDPSPRHCARNRR